MCCKSISKSLLNEVAILENLAKQENFVSNSLGNKVGIFSNLAFLPSARASLRARIRLRIAVSRIGAGLPARSRKFPRLFPAPSPRPLSRRLLLGREFFPWLSPSSVLSPRPPPPQQIPTPAALRFDRSSSSLMHFPDQFLFPRHGHLLHDLVVNLGFICSSGGGLDLLINLGFIYWRAAALYLLNICCSCPVFALIFAEYLLNI